jgi:hypothetical protein
MKRRNSISGQFAARLIEMLESPAYRVLSRSGHMVLARIMTRMSPSDMTLTLRLSEAHIMSYWYAVSFAPAALASFAFS